MTLRGVRSTPVGGMISAMMTRDSGRPYDTAFSPGRGEANVHGTVLRARCTGGQALGMDGSWHTFHMFSRPFGAWNNLAYV